MCIMYDIFFPYISSDQLKLFFKFLTRKRSKTSKHSLSWIFSTKNYNFRGFFGENFRFVISSSKFVSVYLKIWGKKVFWSIYKKSNSHKNLAAIVKTIILQTVMRKICLPVDFSSKRYLLQNKINTRWKLCLSNFHNSIGEMLEIFHYSIFAKMIFNRSMQHFVSIKHVCTPNIFVVVNTIDLL